MRLTSSGATAWRHLGWILAGGDIIVKVMLAKHLFGVHCFVYFILIFCYFYYSNSTFLKVFSCFM